MRTDTNFPAEVVDAVIAERDRMRWNPTTVDNLPTRLMCVLAELNEFCEAQTSAEVREELADVALYLVCMHRDLGGSGWRSVGRSTPSLSRRDHARKVEHHVIRAFEFWRRIGVDGAARADAVISLQLALLEVVRAAQSLGIDLDEEMARKTEILRRRPERNGGKHPDS